MLTRRFLLPNTKPRPWLSDRPILIDLRVYRVPVPSVILTDMYHLYCSETKLSRWVFPSLISLDFSSSTLRLINVFHICHCNSYPEGSTGSIHLLMFAVLSFYAFILFRKGSFSKALNALKRLFLGFNQKVTAVGPYTGRLRSFVCVSLSLWQLVTL